MGCGAAWRQEQEAEEARKRARYKEAIRLIREYQAEWESPSPDLVYRRRCRERLFEFAATEPTEPAERGQKEG